MLDTCEMAGFRVQHEKTQGPSRVLEFLGITIDTISGQLRISEDRMQEIRELLS